MGVDVTAYTMYGKEFDSFDDAADFLVSKGLLTDEEADEAKEYGEFYECGKLPKHLDYQTYSCYQSCGGILGVQITVRGCLENLAGVKSRMEQMDDIVGPGCKLHSFCQWH